MATLADVLRQTGYSQDGTLAAPATESPMTKALSEHIKTLPQQLATNQAALDSAIGSWNKTDFGTGLPNPNYRPEAIAELTQLMPNIGGLTAWHGTPHKIQGKFDVSKIGTGEGNQSFGHGMYFAESPEVAKTYKQDFLQSDATIKSLQKFRDEAPKGSADWEHYNTLMNRNKEGNLYKVDIPDQDIPTMMLWDKPLGEQSAFVKKAVNSLKKQVTPEMRDELGGDLNVLFGKDVTPAQFLNTWEIIHPESKIGIGEELLNKAGVKGIRYWDMGSRQGEQGTSNFVVFDPSTVKILEENGKPLTRKELIEKQVKDLKD